MATLRPTLRPTSPAGLTLRSAIVALALATGWIHSTLGGLLFSLNAVGYVVAAAAMAAPIGLAIRLRWFIRLGLIAYAATAIGAWFVMGPRYDIAYIAKAIEVALIALLLVEVRAYDGNPLRRLRRPVHPAARA
jgi:hypothetical protein